MTRDLHELLIHAVARYSPSDAAAKSGVPKTMLSEWSRAPLRNSYRRARRDQEHIDALRQLLGSDLPSDARTPESDYGHRAEGDRASYGQPEGKSGVAQNIQRMGVYAGGAPVDAPPAPEIIGVTAGDHRDVQQTIRRMTENYEAERALETRRQRQVIPHAYGPIAYFLFGDLHFGGSGTDVARAFSLLREIKSVPGARIGVFGDLVDSYVVGKLLAVRMGMRTSVPDEWAVAQEWLREASPVLDFVVGGNHDAWHMALSGMDQLRAITPGHALYDKDEIKMEVRVGRASFRLWARHQFKGSSQWNSTHAEEKAVRMDDPDQDILMSGHTHPGAMVRESVIHGRRKGIIKVGAFKKIDDYARRIGFPRNDASDVAGLILMDDGRWMGSACTEMIIDYMHAVYGRRAA